MMEEEQEKSGSPSGSAPTAMVVDAPGVGLDIGATLPPGVGAVQPVVPQPAVPFTPTLAPIPSASGIPRPLAPLPPRAPVRPPVVQNGDTGGSESEEEDEDLGQAEGGSGLDYEMSEESKIIKERQERAMQELLMRRRAAALAVPTNDKAVRTRLRRLGEPMTLFGEREMERRDRLRMLMAKLDAEGQLERLMQAHEDEEAAAEDGMDEEIEYPFYTEGSKALQEARVEITKYSIVKAALRLHRARRKRDDPDEDLDAEMDYALNQARSLSIDFSENGDDRPLSGCSVSPDGKMLATW